MRVHLDVLEGPRKGRAFVFNTHDMFIVGRSRFVPCPIPEDEALSREHFIIEFNPPRCVIRDLDSLNHTFVNSRKIQQARLSSGDCISAGQSVFRVRFEGVPRARDSSVIISPIDLPAQAAAKPTSAPGLETAESESIAGLVIVCAACGKPAPIDVDIASNDDSDLTGSIQWLCDDCRDEADLLPQFIPYHTTLRELGRGAMGVVYLARDNRNGRKVALKLIAPETAAARSAVERFLRETAVLARLKHPNIIELYEQGTERGRFWFAMEYVDGCNLEWFAHENPGRYPVNQACRMACHVLKGLEHAHGLGFVHRDIKPENILIGQGPKGLIAKVSDFGLAKSYQSHGFSGLTFSGEMRGTIPFMPPEQMRDFRTVTPSADLYSTAATLYFLITGHFLYDEDIEADPIRLLLEATPVPIQHRRHDVPTGLAVVIEKCLRREPEDRYPNATEMRRALKPFC